MPLIKCRKPEGTYLMWLDARALGEPDAVFKALCEAGVGLKPRRRLRRGQPVRGLSALLTWPARAHSSKPRWIAWKRPIAH